MVDTTRPNVSNDGVTLLLQKLGILNIDEAGGAKFEMDGTDMTADLLALAGTSAVFKFSSADALTAHAGGTQAAALQLTKTINRVSVAAAAADSVALPAATAGRICLVINDGANPIQVFGAVSPGTDTINGIAAATGVSQGIGTVALYACVTAGNWEVAIPSLWSTKPQALAANTAIPSHAAHSYVITKGSIEANTLAAPTAGTDDGIEIIITSDTAFAHTLTATGLLDTGSASVNVATFAAFKGAGLTLMAYNGRWKVLASVGITFS